MSKNERQVPSDADFFASVRWSVNTLENLALDAYWQNSDSWEEVLECLASAMDCIEHVRASMPTSCKYEVCPDGRCRPICWPK